MKRYRRAGSIIFLCLLGIGLISGAGAIAADKPADDAKAFPRSLDSYDDADVKSITAILKNRIKQEPFNLIATLIFFCAIVHTFLTSKFTAVSHKWEHEHEEKIKQGLVDRHSVHHGAELFHFLGEVEAVFGIWVVALVGAIFAFYDWKTVVNYIGYRVNFTEAMFVVVIMTLASTRPILKLSESIMWKIADLLGGTLTAWWFTILTIGPLLGSLITEPAAMTISALLLAHRLYDLEPSEKFKYATIGLLFVNISVGGTLTHFAAPPVLMVAGPWNWGIGHMLVNFGWKALVGIVISNGVYYAFFRRELARLQESYVMRSIKEEIRLKYLSRRELDAEFEKIAASVDEELGFRQIFGQQIEKVMPKIKQRMADRLSAKYLPSIVREGIDQNLVRDVFDKRFDEVKLARMREFLPGLLPEHERAEFQDPQWDERDDPVPAWVTIFHVAFMAWTIVNAHHPELFIPGLLFFLGFSQVTSPFQNRIDLKPALLVGFFLGGLVIHGGVQGWWIAPVLGNLTDIPLMLMATVLTAFNDNAAITYLSTLVPGFTDSLKYAVVAGAVAGGGLTVIANAPNPAGQSILKKYFENGVSPAGLLKAAILPTIIVWLCYLIFR
ncbi:MAG: putative Na+/H+ antiporter [Desulfobacterales bacterium]|nr:MAG: putative Na+/H+ antiporter [Desulfobacterales bacterium]